jgi:hypothetical protein
MKRIQENPRERERAAVPSGQKAELREIRLSAKSSVHRETVE